MHPNVTEESILKANSQFWEQMLTMCLNPIRQTEKRCIGAGHVLASCDLSGAWCGRIEIRLSRGLSLEATAAMLMQAKDQVRPEDILDAAKEIANMIAGIMKSALPRRCAMTVPEAEVSPGDFCIPPRTGDSVTVFFHHPAGELMVRVWEFAAEAQQAGLPLLTLASATG